MASVPLSKDYLSSTPIQQHHGGSCKRYFTSPMKGFDVLSPIKKIFPQRRNLFDNCSSSNYNSIIKINKNRSVIGFDKYFKFTEVSNVINVSYTDKLDSDSGIESDSNFTTSGDQSLIEKLTSFPTDENCNVISNCDTLNENSSQLSKFLSSKILHGTFEYTKSENLFENLDNRNKITATHEKQNLNSNLDILGELNLRNCFGVVSLVLSYLPDEDLIKVSHVSKEWQDIVFTDKKANERRKSYINKKRNFATGPQKENRYHSKRDAEKSHKSAFLSVINCQVEESQQPLDLCESTGRFDSFIKESQSLLNDEKLVKCPKCLYPSKAQSRHKYSCTRNLCQHIFCKKCMGPCFDYHQCSMPKLNSTVPVITIGSKLSKKNLRRL